MTAPWRSAFLTASIFGIAAIVLVYGLLGTSIRVALLIVVPMLAGFAGFVVLDKLTKTASARRIGTAAIWIGLLAVAVGVFALMRA